MRYGKFSKNGKEFIIDNVETPSPWINYIYNENYFATISNNGGGISYYKNPLHGRITRYRINEVLSDRPGKYIYIRDNDTGEFWSLTWQPVGKNSEAYKVYHGFGYTRVESNVNNLISDLKYFVPEDEDVEIWNTTLKNNSSKKRNLSVFGYVEFALGHALIDLINQCDDQHFNTVYFDQELNSLFATKRYWVTDSNGTQQQENKEWDRWAYFSCNHKIVEYETIREKFIGKYRNESNPVGIENNKLTSEDTDYGNAVGAIKFDIELEPGEEENIIFKLGVVEKNLFDVQKKTVKEKYNTTEEVENAFNKINSNWDNVFKTFKAETPDDETNKFINYWTPYQAKVAFDVGRVASYYYWGIGRGFGFRDTAQDTYAIVKSSHTKAKERVLMLARQMFSSGKVYHHFYDNGSGETTGHCDDPLWFILAVTDYIKETGDFNILDERESFTDDKEGTILEHLLAVVNYVKNNLGPNCLPIFGRGDWNDTLDYIGGEDGGESIWGGMFYVAMLNELLLLLKHIKFNVYDNEINSVKEKISKSLNEKCWDGDWYLRAFGEKGKKIGSSENEYGKIFLNTQSWAVIADLYNKENLVKALDSVKENLDTKYGPKICAPAYKEIDKNVGLITRCVAGKKENAAVFCHAATWLLLAECLMGNGNRAYDYYKKLLPSYADQDTFVAEPYVYSQYITSDEHKTEGRASHSWQTGSAAWMNKVTNEFILGIKATYNGLKIDPVIPSEWKSFKVERIFRGTKYYIEVENPENIENGISKIIVDGKEQSIQTLPISNNAECKVRIVMGRNSFKDKIKKEELIDAR